MNNGNDGAANTLDSKMLTPYFIAQPAITADYVDKIIDYAVEKDWGQSVD